jgi:hypothetical protein
MSLRRDINVVACPWSASDEEKGLRSDELEVIFVETRIEFDHVERRSFLMQNEESEREIKPWFL